MKFQTYLSIGLRNLSVRMEKPNLLHFWLFDAQQSIQYYFIGDKGATASH